MGAVGFHELGLGGESFRRAHVAHHQKAGHIHAQPARIFDVLFGNIGFCAMRRHAHGPHTQFKGVLQIVHGADSRQQQGGEFRVRQNLGDCTDPVPIGMRAKTIIEAGAAQPIAMRDFDGVNTRQIQRTRNGLHVRQAILVANGVHAVAQRHVLDV